MQEELDLNVLLSGLNLATGAAQVYITHPILPMHVQLNQAQTPA